MYKENVGRGDKVILRVEIMRINLKWWYYVGLKLKNN